MTERDAIVFRSATAEDIPRMVELLTFGSLTPDREDLQNERAYVQAINELQESGVGEVVVGDLSGTVVAVAQLCYLRHLQHQGGLCAEIESVHVHPEFRNKGIGTDLMAELVARATARGAYRVQLTSNQSRVDAHRFYERLGFTPSHVGFKRLLTP